VALLRLSSIANEKLSNCSEVSSFPSDPTERGRDDDYVGCHQTTPNAPPKKKKKKTIQLIPGENPWQFLASQAIVSL
jgi:hypothetical protein